MREGLYPRRAKELQQIQHEELQKVLNKAVWVKKSLMDLGNE